MRKSTKEAIDILKATAKSTEALESRRSAPPAEEEMDKALTASVASSVARQMQLHQHSAGIAHNQPTVGTNRLRGDYEPPVVPVRRVEPVIATGPVEVHKSCTSCGYMHKSASPCPRCKHVADMGGEALPLPLRGR